MNVFEVFGRIGLDPTDYEQGLEEAQQVTQEAADRMANQLDRSMNAMDRRLKLVGESFVRFGQRWSLMVTTPILGLAGTSIKAASDAEETASKFAVVYQDVGDEAETAANRMRESFGMSSTAAQRLLGDTGDLLTGFGFTADAALDLSVRTNELAVDLASFTNYSGGAEGASEALTKALLGETESLKSLGISISQADVEAKVLEMTQQGLTFETERQAKAQATLELAIGQSKNAVGDFARTSGSFANLMRTLNARVGELRVEFGEMLLPIATRVVGVVTRMATWFTNLNDMTKRVILWVGLLVAAIGPLTIAWGWYLINLPKIRLMFQLLGAAIKGAAWPVTLLMIAIAALAVAWENNWFGIQEFTARAIDYVTERISWIVRAGQSVIENWDTVAATWREILMGMGAIVRNTGRIISGGFQVATSAVKLSFASMFRYVEDGLQGIVNGLIRMLNAAVGLINRTFGSDIGELVPIELDAWASSADGAADAMVEAEQRVRDGVRGIEEESALIRSAVERALGVIAAGMEDTEEGVAAIATATETAGIDVAEFLELLETDADAAAAALERVATAAEEAGKAATRAWTSRVDYMRDRDSSYGIGDDRDSVPDSSTTFGGIALDRVRMQIERDQIAADRAAVEADAAAADAARAAATLSTALSGRQADQVRMAEAEFAQLQAYTESRERVWQAQVDAVTAERRAAAELRRTEAAMHAANLRAATAGFLADRDRMAADRAALEALDPTGTALTGTAGDRAAMERDRAARDDTMRYASSGMQADRFRRREESRAADEAARDGRRTTFGGMQGDRQAMREDRSEASDPQEILRQEMEARQAVIDGLLTVSADNGPLKNFGASLMSLVADSVPLFGAAIEGFVQGGPIGALTAVFSELLGRSEVFQRIMGKLNDILEPIVGIFDTLLTAIEPIIDVAVALVEVALAPLVWIVETIVAPVLQAFADMVMGIYNFFARIFRWKQVGQGGGGGLIENLEAERADLQRQLDEAETESQIASINAQIAAVDAEIDRLRNLGTGSDDAGNGDEAPESTQTFGGTSHAVQLAIATPLVEASWMMHDAAELMRNTLVGQAGEIGWSALPPFTEAISSLTPLIQRLVDEGVNISVATGAGANAQDSRTAFLRST